jgi:hypothetical protein
LFENFKHKLFELENDLGFFVLLDETFGHGLDLLLVCAILGRWIVIENNLSGGVQPELHSNSEQKILTSNQMLREVSANYIVVWKYGQLFNRCDTRLAIMISNRLLDRLEQALDRFDLILAILVKVVGMLVLHCVAHSDEK